MISDPTKTSLLDGIAPTIVTHEGPISKKEFRGWHKPRKQLIRRDQWLSEVEALMPLLNQDVNLIRYLTLPGQDMLDIRLMARLCDQNSLGLRVLGFDEERAVETEVNDTEINISSSEVRNIILRGSVILPDNLSVLKSKKSQGYMHVEEKGPFDVINLDLCGSISCIEHPDNHQVLNNLCEYQVNRRREPWLLFITTRAEFREVNPSHLPHYLKPLHKNAHHSSVFADRLTAITGFDARDYDGESIPDDFNAPTNGFNFVKIFTSGLAKWLLNLMLTSQITWTVKMLDSYWYRVEDNQKADSYPNMLSLAFKFLPVDLSLGDPSGLADGNPSAEIDEATLAIEILEKLETMIDIDQRIDEDEDLYSILVSESEVLLAAARYPIDQYQEWAEQKRIHFLQT